MKVKELGDECDSEVTVCSRGGCALLLRCTVKLRSCVDQVAKAKAAAGYLTTRHRVTVMKLSVCQHVGDGCAAQ